MRSVFFMLLLLTFTESSSVESESDLLSSVDIVAFGHSLNASRHWDCPRVGDRVAKIEEARIWQTVIPDACIKETVVTNRNKALLKAEQYKWINEPSRGPVMQNSVILGMRRPDFDGSTAPVKVLYSKSKQVNQNALSVLSQLEHSKDKILEWMARTQASLHAPSMILNITDPFLNQYFREPHTTNYHQYVFKDARFTVGDLVAWMALAAASCQKGHADAFKFFKLMMQSLLPGFSVSLEAAPTSSAGNPTKTVVLHRSFQYVPAGADLAFYFDGNRGKFLTLSHSSIVLNRPEGIANGQQHAALVLSSDVYADASSLDACQTMTDITMRKASYKELEKALALHVPSGTTEAEVQAIGVPTIRSCAAQLERNSFLEAQRKVLESKPTLLIELLPEKLVKLVIDYFSDGACLFTVYTHRWSFNRVFGITVDSARVYAITSEGIRGLNHSSANLEESKRHCLEFGSPRWSSYLLLMSSHDGQYVSFCHKYKASTARGKTTEYNTKWLAQGDRREDEKPERIAFDGEGLSFGLLSRDGRTLCSCGKTPRVTRVYQIVEEAGKSPFAVMKFELNDEPHAVSGKGDRVMVANAERLEIHDVGKDESRRICRINVVGLGFLCALNEDGSEAAFVIKNEELRVVKVDSVVGNNIEQSAIVLVKVPQSLGKIFNLMYSSSNKLHVRHNGGGFSLFDPSTNALIPIETPQEEQGVIYKAVSQNADYTAILQCVGEEGRGGGKRIYKATVKRILGEAEWKTLFGYGAGKVASSVGQTKSPSEKRR